MVGVTGSIPVAPTTFTNDLANFPNWLLIAGVIKHQFLEHSQYGAGSPEHAFHKPSVGGYIGSIEQKAQARGLFVYVPVPLPPPRHQRHS